MPVFDGYPACTDSVAWRSFGESRWHSTLWYHEPMTTKTTRKMPQGPKSPQGRAQRQRFIDAAREAGASEDEAVFRENLKRLAKQKPQSTERQNNGSDH